MTKIVRLQAHNIKKLRAIDIHPGGGIVPIRGRNAMGKSSTLDAIQMALGGADATPPRPIRAGEDEGAIRLELDNGTIIVRRFVVDGKPTLEVTNGDGFKAPSPQKMLDSLYASVAFDPIAFMREKPAVQLETVRRFTKLDVDLPAIEKRVKDAYDARTEKNREVTREKARLEQMPIHEAPAEAVDETALDEQIATAAEANATLERRRANREDFKSRLQSNRDRLAQIVAQIAELEATKTEFEQAIAEQEATLEAAEALPDPVDITALQEQQRTARATNEKVRANKARATQATLVATLEAEAAALTKTVDDGRAEIASAFERAEMPVPGLSFGDGEVLLNGLPLEQASAAEQLRLSTAIGIATSPKLRVMLVRDGSLLDPEGEKILADMAAEHDFQLWVEAVDPTGAVGIVIEDGSVVAIDGEPAPEPEQLDKPKRRQKKAEQEQIAEQAREVLTPAAEPEEDWSGGALDAAPRHDDPAPAAEDPTPMRHRCETCMTVDGHTAGCPENEAPFDPADAVATPAPTPAPAPKAAPTSDDLFD